MAITIRDKILDELIGVSYHNRNVTYYATVEMSHMLNYSTDICARNLC